MGDGKSFRLIPPEKTGEHLNSFLVLFSRPKTRTSKSSITPGMKLLAEGETAMAEKYQRGWLKKERRTQGDTWVLFFRKTRKFDGKRVESKIPIGLVENLPEKRHAWAEVERLHLAINQVNSRRAITFGDIAQHYAEH